MSIFEIILTDKFLIVNNLNFCNNNNDERIFSKSTQRMLFCLIILCLLRLFSCIRSNPMHLINTIKYRYNDSSYSDF